MSSSIKPLVLYGSGTPTPNPAKVGIVLEELGIPYTVKKVNMQTELKVEPFISLNPNGRLPAVEDPNTGAVLFEV